MPGFCFPTASPWEMQLQLSVSPILVRPFFMGSLLPSWETGGGFLTWLFIQPWPYFQCLFTCFQNITGWGERGWDSGVGSLLISKWHSHTAPDRKRRRRRERRGGKRKKKEEKDGKEKEEVENHDRTLACAILYILAAGGECGRLNHTK